MEEMKELRKTVDMFCPDCHQLLRLKFLNQALNQKRRILNCGKCKIDFEHIGPGKKIKYDAKPFKERKIRENN